MTTTVTISCSWSETRLLAVRLSWGGSWGIAVSIGETAGSVILLRREGVRQGDSCGMPDGLLAGTGSTMVAGSAAAVVPINGDSAVVTASITTTTSSASAEAIGSSSGVYASVNGVQATVATSVASSGRVVASAVMLSCGVLVLSGVVADMGMGGVTDGWETGAAEGGGVVLFRNAASMSARVKSGGGWGEC